RAAGDVADARERDRGRGAELNRAGVRVRDIPGRRTHVIADQADVGLVGGAADEARKAFDADRRDRAVGVERVVQRVAEGNRRTGADAARVEDVIARADQVAEAEEVDGEAPTVIDRAGRVRGADRPDGRRRELGQ